MLYEAWWNLFTIMNQNADYDEIGSQYFLFYTTNGFDLKNHTIVEFIRFVFSAVFILFMSRTLVS